jgi:hypothetical protein
MDTTTVSEILEIYAKMETEAEKAYETQLEHLTELSRRISGMLHQRNNERMRSHQESKQRSARLRDLLQAHLDGYEG